MNETKGESEGEKRIKGSSTALRTLGVLYELQGAGVTELANYLDLSKGTVHPHLKTLCEEGFVVQNGDEYKVSLECLNIGVGVRNQIELYRAGMEEVAELADETGEYAHLMVEQNGWGYIIQVEEGANASATTSRVGKRLYLHCTSGGKAIQAFMPRGKVETIIDKRGLPKKTENTVSDRKELLEVLEEIRQRGVALDMQEHLHGARSVGAPVLAPDEEVMGAVTVSGPATRLKDDRIEKDLPEKVQSAANVIEMNIEINRLNE